jgi:hypothetical protein
MTEVRAIEVADGQHRSAVGLLWNPAVNLHKRLKKAAIITGKIIPAGTRGADPERGTADG